MVYIMSHIWAPDYLSQQPIVQESTLLHRGSRSWTAPKLPLCTTRHCLMLAPCLSSTPIQHASPMSSSIAYQAIPAAPFAHWATGSSWQDGRVLAFAIHYLHHPVTVTLLSDHWMYLKELFRKKIHNSCVHGFFLLIQEVSRQEERSFFHISFLLATGHFALSRLKMADLHLLAWFCA